MASSWSSGATVQHFAYDDQKVCDIAEGTDENDFTFVDFLPEIRKSGGFFTTATYETFRTLVDRANVFLRSNWKWKIVTCESIEFTSRSDKVDPMKMTYLEYGEGQTFYIRGLRLWLTERKEKDEREQQIGYFNLIPKQLEKGGIFSSAKFETLDTAIARFNSMLQSNPLPGRIITIESQEMKVTNFQKFDADRSNWSEQGSGVNTYVFVIRIFFEMMTGNSEEIGVKDFVPDKLSEGGIISLPKYERFSNVVDKASAWCFENRDLRFCNVQTLEIKVKKGNEVDTQKMDYFEHGSTTTFYVRALRVTYTKPFSNHYSDSEKQTFIKQITCRTFLPIQLTTGILVPEFENLAATRERISAWVKATGARVLSAETVAYRVMTGGERKEGPEATFSYNLSDNSKYWMFVIRLYLDGVYEEPPPEMLPAVPTLEQSCCRVS